ncbi:MAG: ATP-binding protein [Pseudomonadota bacterium]
MTAVMTAVVAAIATLLLVKMMPGALKLASGSHLRTLVEKLEFETKRRESVEKALEAAHAALERRVLERTAEYVLRNRQLHEEIVEHHRVEAALRESQLILSSARRLALSNAGFDKQKIFTDLLNLLAENHPFPTSAIYRNDRRTGEFMCIAAHGMPHDGMSSFHFPAGLLASAAQSGEIDTIACTDRSRPLATLPVGVKPLIQTLIVPVMYQNQCMSVLIVAGTQTFSPAEIAFIESLRVQLGVAQHNLRLYADSKRLAQELHTRNIEIAQKNLQLQDISRTKSEFVANMSHELRTPLNAVIGFTGTLLMRLPGPLTADQEKQLRTIQSSARHLLSLINELLDVEKIESGKMDIHLEPVVLQVAVRDVLDTLQPLAAEKKLALQHSLPQSDITILTDRRALQQILINLLNNAIKFTDEGHVAIRLSRRHTGAFGTVELTVADTGIGIPAERLGELFQAFTQLDATSTRRHEGTGLGLYLSQRLAIMIGAQLRCKSEYGQGSEFTLALPVQRS